MRSKVARSMYPSWWSGSKTTAASPAGRGMTRRWRVPSARSVATAIVRRYGVRPGIDGIREHHVEPRITDALPDEVPAVGAVDGHLEPVRAHPEQHLPRTAEFEDLLKHQADRVLHARTGMLLERPLRRFAGPHAHP